MEKQSKPNAIELTQMAEAPPVLWPRWTLELFRWVGEWRPQFYTLLYIEPVGLAMIMGDGWSKCEMTFRLPVAVLTSPDAITAVVVMVAADVCSTFSCLFVKIKGVCFARCIICTNFDDVIIKIISI